MWQTGDKTLGILGGMGPLATQLFYKMIIDMTEAGRDQDHLDMIILNHASMPDRTEAIKSGKIELLYNLLLKDVKKLEKNGVAAIAIPCNTSHLLVDRLQMEVQIPIIHMIRETVQSIKQQLTDIKRVGILATDGTIASGLYQKTCEDSGVQPILLSKEGQALVMKIIYEGVKGGRPIDYNDFIRIEGELSAKGCERAIMGCTELSCLKDMYRLPDYYIDAMEVLATRSIQLCGKRLKPLYHRGGTS